MTGELLNDYGQPLGDPLPDWAGANMPDDTPIIGKHCRLERLNPQLHTQPLFDALIKTNKVENWTYLPYGPFETFEAFSLWVHEISLGKDPLFFVVVSLEENIPLGLLSLLAIKPQRGSIEVGNIHYPQQLQRTVMATEAMFLIMQNVFETLGFRRYEWKCNNLNSPSKKAALRLGFQFEGVFRQHLVVKGHNRDTAWFSVIDNEWPELKTAYQVWLADENFDDQGRKKKSLSGLIRKEKEFAL